MLPSKKFLVRTKYAVSHKMPMYSYIRLLAFNAWHAVPNVFVKSLICSSRFVFVCGCGHSGTTLASAKIGLHGNVFFNGRETNAFFPFGDSFGCYRLMEEWDHLAKADGCEIVLEKTPKHVYAIKKIKKLLPNASFLIMTRNPLDNVASLKKRFGDLDSCIRRWNSDNKEVSRWKGVPGVYVVKYEDLTLQPSEKFEDIFNFLGLVWDSSILKPSDTAYNDVMQDSELYAARVAQVSKEVRPNLGEWKAVLSPQDAAYVMKETEHVARELGYTREFINELGVI